MVALRLLVCALLLASSACDDFKQFRGTYEGEIVEGNFVRSCFASRTEASLSFDPDQAVAPLGAVASTQPNTLTTNDGTFQQTALEPISNLPHDPLSELDFPGPQRLRNFMLLARPETGPLAGRDALVVISLLANEAVEVRVIARSSDGATTCPGAEDAEDAGTPLPTSGRREYFGFWRMEKK